MSQRALRNFQEMVSALPDGNRYGELLVTSVALRASSHLVGLGVEREGVSQAFWIGIEGLGSAARREMRALAGNLSVLREIYATLQALKLSSHFARLRTECELLLRERTIPLSLRMRRATRLVSEVAFNRAPSTVREFLGLVDDLVVGMTQEIVGRDWFRSTQDGAAGASLAAAFLEACEGAVGELRAESVARQPSSRRGRSWHAVSGRVKALAEVARVSQPDRHLSFPNVSRLDQATAHAVRWSAIAEGCRRASRSPHELHEELTEEMGGALEVTRNHLAKVLSRRGNVGLSRGIGGWLHLWFLHQVMSHLGTQEVGGGRYMLAPELWKLRRDLAYLLRENLRRVTFSELPSDDFPLEPYLRALANIVAYHAEWHVGVPPELDMGLVLSEIGTARHSDDARFALAHLEHACDVYIGGHFLSSILLEGVPGSGGWTAGVHTVGDLLASKAGLPPGPESRRSFLRAFSIAALFHDIGMILFPRSFFRCGTLSAGDGALASALERAPDGLRKAARKLVGRCAADLEAAHYFDAQDEQPLASWIEESVTRGSPDHSVLGAWYTGRMLTSAGSLSPEVVRSSVRSILLHQISTQPVDVDKDPVAALLVLCDELFEWLPATDVLPGIVSEDAALRVESVTVGASRALSSRIESLKVVEENGAVTCLLESHGAAEAWPVIQIRLQDPDRLPSPVYEIWLRVSQNLGRLRGADCGWKPAFRIRSQIPGQLRSVGLSTLTCLEELVQISRSRVRMDLKGWLRGRGKCNTEGEEEVLVGGDRERPWASSITESFEVLSRDYQRVIMERSRVQRR